MKICVIIKKYLFVGMYLFIVHLVTSPYPFISTQSFLSHKAKRSACIFYLHHTQSQGWINSGRGRGILAPKRGRLLLCLLAYVYLLFYFAWNILWCNIIYFLFCHNLKPQKIFRLNHAFLLDFCKSCFWRLFWIILFIY